MGKVVRFVFFISILILLPAGVLADDGDVAADHRLTEAVAAATEADEVAAAGSVTH